jgi:hypothetical protein
MLICSYFVMAGLDPAIHENKDVDPRDKPGDDGTKRNCGAVSQFHSPTSMRRRFALGGTAG